MSMRMIALAVIIAVSGIGAAFLAYSPKCRSVAADPNDAELVALGSAVNIARCASCHGMELEGQADWRERRADGRLPAPPHDASGHTWHHSDQQLFTITKRGVRAIVPGYQSDMPAFEEVLTDREIWAVLAYIKNTWPPDIRARQARLNGTTK